MKKIAVPITRNNQIEEHFGHCEFYEIYTFSNTNEVLDVQLLKSEQGCVCKSNFISLLENEGVTLMLSDGIGNNAINKLNNAGIEIIRGCSGSSAEVILQFIEGEISDSDISCLKHAQHHGDGHNHVCDH
ncbi:NifB/NifX family molybdenum-iron cluster-binding protein [Flavivirga abyssicola]|uniref:NifB/NifX family molybdenum-iron cluster-binding protein n=1 Tax=Flavivirga abyssicola TaxID=3063533 RepID=UPI0026DF0FC4|nr:NifB/NifX family molybdenum-iron cluster-binding protein [Flavivirga sp. MEBiC07777]WVK13577.1 NifB/NifX family molybdenum-iron cluster-binding protein [Flavivirga sp. MEBiC07777]